MGAVATQLFRVGLATLGQLDNGFGQCIACCVACDQIGAEFVLVGLPSPIEGFLNNLEETRIENDRIKQALIPRHDTPSRVR